MNAFKRNLLISYGLSLALLILSATASYVSIRKLLDSQEVVNRTNLIITKVEEVLSTLKDAETGQRGYLLSDREEFLGPYNGALDRANATISELMDLTKDNEQQLQAVVHLKNIVVQRMSVLQQLIDYKKVGGSPSLDQLRLGKSYMDAARKVVQEIQDRETVLLAARTEKVNRFATSTPTLILIASLLAILVTGVSFVRVNRDFDKRLALQQELQKKDAEITARLNLIKDIAEKISAGDYKTRVSDEGADVLGSLGGSLNKMASSLDYSFTNLSNNEWLQKGIARLNEIMIGERELSVLANTVLGFLASATGADMGAFYLTYGRDDLTLAAGHAIDPNASKKINLNEGFVGQAAASHSLLRINDIPDDVMVLHAASGALRPKSILAIPVYYETRLKGVIELATVKEFHPMIEEFLKTAVFNIGMAIHSALDHQRLQELLAETQAQSEELQSQHGELENINAELEAQAEKLQASEEELKVQQEELQQSNQELEERSRLLEEKNELILERNLEIQAKAEQLELSTRYKSEFLANMSHELRTPLNSILLLSRLLSENHSSNLSQDQIDYANVIQTSGRGLLTLIDEILDLSKIESGKMELEYNHVPLEEINEDLRAMFEPMAREKGIEFSVATGNEVPGFFETDRLRLEQILRNLISNALKFTRKGSVKVKISGQHGNLLFSVLDTGIGIPKDKQQTIFEAFQQADGSTRRQFGGTGLGLSISRELAKLLGGEIRLHSEEGKGSEFTLILPAEKGKNISERPAPAQAPAQPEPAEKTKDSTKNYLSPEIPSPVADDRDGVKPGDKLILIIEDDTGFARSLLDYTRQKGYKGLVAVRGDEGIELARQFLPLGILLDVQLPVKSGWDVMEALKSDPVTRPIPVHMMSSHEVKNRSLSKGAVDFINKPVAFEQLGAIFQKIEQALSRHPKKVLIVEENTKHAQALSYFLDSYNVSSEIRSSVDDGIRALGRNEVDCVILDMGIPAQRSYELLEDVKKTPGLENLPIIVFTGKNLSHVEDMRIRQYADTIVVKTANSYQRILDEVSLFLHLVEESKTADRPTKYKKLGELGEVLKGKTVLVADDDVRNIFSLTKSLENYGMNVISAIDGKDAIRQLNEHGKVDLILMDMMMPEMDGYESTRQIRKIPAYRNLPIIAVTAKAMTGDREKCIAAGASDYITKPVDVDQLMSLLRVWLYE